jgi:hypothetical protein
MNCHKAVMIMKKFRYAEHKHVATIIDDVVLKFPRKL